MSELERYMTDPDIVGEPMPLREIHAIRIMNYERTKNLSPTEIVRLCNEETAPIIEKYGLMRVS